MVATGTAHAAPQLCDRSQNSDLMPLRAGAVHISGGLRDPADSCGAYNVFVNVATIRSDAFWFSAVR